MNESAYLGTENQPQDSMAVVYQDMREGGPALVPMSLSHIISGCSSHITWVLENVSHVLEKLTAESIGGASWTYICRNIPAEKGSLGALWKNASMFIHTPSAG